MMLDALIFPYSPGAVVTKRALDKALSKVKGRNNAVVIVGWDFTVEARAAVEATTALLLSNREFGWTDAMWAKTKQSDRPGMASPEPSLSIASSAEPLVVARDFLLKGMPWDLSRPHFIENQRDQIADKAQADPMFTARLREVALEALTSEDPSVIRRGLTALAFVGTDSDLPLVARLKTHAESFVARDAGTCVYEIKRSLGT